MAYLEYRSLDASEHILEAIVAVDETRVKV